MSIYHQRIDWLCLIPKCQHSISFFVKECAKLPDVCISQFLVYHLYDLISTGRDCFSFPIRWWFQGHDLEELEWMEEG